MNFSLRFERNLSLGLSSRFEKIRFCTLFISIYIHFFLILHNYINNYSHSYFVLR